MENLTKLVHDPIEARTFLPKLKPGVQKVSRYRLEKTNDPKMQKYLAIYEIDSPEVVDSPAWKEKGEWGDWAPKIRPHTTERHHSFFKKIP